MNMNKQALFASMLLLVAGCARREADEPAQAGRNENKSESPAAIEEQSVPPGNIAPVLVNIALTEQAQAALKAESEKVLVVAVYAGDPNASDEAQKMADASGTIKLGENRQTLDGPGSLTLDEDVIDKTRLKLVEGEVQLMINVTSSKTNAAKNLLACDFFWQPLGEASKNPVGITCKAVSEANASQS